MAPRRGVRGRRVLYAVQYAVVLTAIVFLGLTVISLPLGWGFVGVKIGLFVVGVATLGYGTYLAWPSSPEDLLEQEDEPEEKPGFQRFVKDLPPMAWYPLHPAEEYPDWVHVYLATLALFLTSFLMETVFGVVA